MLPATACYYLMWPALKGHATMCLSTVCFMIEFDRDRTKWQQVYELLRGRIEGGIYKERYPIPSLLHLQQELGVAHMTIRKVIGMLKDDGLVNPISGKGTYVLPREQWKPRDLP